MRNDVCGTVIAMHRQQENVMSYLGDVDESVVVDGFRRNAHNSVAKLRLT